MTTMTERDSGPELSALRSGPVGVSTPEEIEAERQRLVPWLEQQIAALPLQRQRRLVRRRRRGIWLAGGASVLATAAAALLVVQWGPVQWGPVQWGPWENAEEAVPRASADGYATLLSGRVLSGSVEILPGSRLGDASVVQSSTEEPAVLSGNSYLARLSPGGELALGVPGAESSRQELRLTRGEVRLSVQRLPQGHTLNVLTEDVRVVVRGTEFSVSLAEEGGVGRSCVRVTEGAVEVHRRGFATVLLGPGQQSGCEEGAAAEAEGERFGQKEAAKGRGQRQVPREPTSTLARESELLASALAAEQSGDLLRARRELNGLLRRYPQSPLAEEARVALARVSDKHSGERE